MLDKLPGLKKNMRKGGTSNFEQSLQAHFAMLAEKLLSSPAPAVSSEDLNTILLGLKVFNKGQLYSKILDWATNHNVEMAVADIKAWCSNYLREVNKQEEAACAEPIPIAVATLKGLIAKLPDAVPDDVLEKLYSTMPHLILRSFMQAGQTRAFCFSSSRATNLCKFSMQL